MFDFSHEVFAEEEYEHVELVLIGLVRSHVEIKRVSLSNSADFINRGTGAFVSEGLTRMIHHWLESPFLMRKLIKIYCLVRT